MPRLFATQREMDFFNDIGKEITKDVIGQQIIYWAISALKTKTHPVYNEAVKKIFENPIRVDALVGQPTWETRMTNFGPEQVNKLDVFLQARDIAQKNIEVYEGDYFTYGEQAYEIVSYVNMNNFFGQVEHDVGFKITGILARVGEFNPQKFYKPTEESLIPDPAPFEQQRGLPTNIDGPTGDIRDVRRRLGDDALGPIALGDGPRSVGADSAIRAGSIYDE